MKPSKSTECPHRISSFQAHSGCNKLAAICEKECQQLHETNNDVVYSSVDLVEEHFRLISEGLAKQTKPYLDRVRESVKHINYECQKQLAFILKKSQREIQTEFFESIALDENVMQKIQNKRYERIKCNQLNNFLEIKYIGVPAKACAFPAIFQFYEQILSKFEEFLKESSLILQSKQNVPSSDLETSPQNKQKSQPSNKQTLPNEQREGQSPITELNRGAFLGEKTKSFRAFSRQEEQTLQLKLRKALQKIKALEEETASLNFQLEKRKYQNNVLNSEKVNLQREILLLKDKLLQLSSKHYPKKTSTLTHKTWNILKVVTKKIKKSTKTSEQNKTIQPHNFKPLHAPDFSIISNPTNSSAGLSWQVRPVTEREQEIIKSLKLNLPNKMDIQEEAPVAQVRGKGPPKAPVGDPSAVASAQKPGFSEAKDVSENQSDSSDFVAFFQKKIQ